MLTTFIVLDSLIAVQTLILIGAAVVAVLVLLRASRAVEALRTSVLELLPRVNESVERINEVIKASQPIGGRAADISADVQKIVESTRGSVENVAVVVNDVSAKVKVQAERVDTVVTDSLNRLETLSNAVTENLVGPMAEISAILRGGYAAAKYFKRSKAPAGGEGNGHEEEIPG